MALFRLHVRSGKQQEQTVASKNIQNIAQAQTSDVFSVGVR